MGNRATIFIVVGLVATIGVPFYIARQLALGEYAKSPQTVRLMLGSTAIIAGGRAKLWFAGGNTGGDFEVRCNSERRYFEPTIGEGCQACDVIVELQKVEEGRPTYGTFRVTWGKAR